MLPAGAVRCRKDACCCGKPSTFLSHGCGDPALSQDLGRGPGWPWPCKRAKGEDGQGRMVGSGTVCARTCCPCLLCKVRASPVPPVTVHNPSLCLLSHPAGVAPGSQAAAAAAGAGTGKRADGGAHQCCVPARKRARGGAALGRRAGGGWVWLGWVWVVVGGVLCGWWLVGG